jgi:hypothetical protein
MKPFDLLAKQFLEVFKQHERATNNNEPREIENYFCLFHDQVDFSAMAAHFRDRASPVRLPFAASHASPIGGQ